MLETEHIVYLARKLHWSKKEIGEMSLAQFIETYNELIFQESVENWDGQFSVASILAAIANTIHTKSHKSYKASDFLSTERPSRDGDKKITDKIDLMAENMGVKLPQKRR